MRNIQSVLLPISALGVNSRQRSYWTHPGHPITPLLNLAEVRGPGEFSLPRCAEPTRFHLERV